MKYRVEANDDKELVLCIYDPGCGCCAETYVVNGEHGWYSEKRKTKQELGDDLRFEVSWMREKIRDLQAYALEHDIDLREHAQSENLPTPWEAENMPIDMVPDQVTMTEAKLAKLGITVVPDRPTMPPNDVVLTDDTLSNLGVTVVPDRLTPYEGDLG